MGSMFEKRQPEVGSRPGTLAIPPGSPAPRISVIRYDLNNVEEFELSDISQLSALRTPGHVVWVDVQGFGDEPTLRAIGAAFELHPLALEDAINLPQRAKTELYQQHQLIITRAPMLADDGDVTAPQVCFIVGDGYLLSFQDRYFGFFDKVRDRIRDGLGQLRKTGADYLAYALIDTMIDNYYPVVQHLAELLEELEDFAISSPHPVVLARIHHIRRQLVRLRRIGWPQREAIHAMLREETEFVHSGTMLYLRDTHGHIAQIVEQVDACRDMAADLAEAYLSNVSHRTNEIMKVLTLMASVFIPLTFIAGIYGMNFEHMPELKNPNGYFFALGSMGILGLAMAIYFYLRGWIGTPPPPDLGTTTIRTPTGDSK